jgi:hypothetical protein
MMPSVAMPPPSGALMGPDIAMAVLSEQFDRFLAFDESDKVFDGALFAEAWEAARTMRDPALLMLARKLVGTVLHEQLSPDEAVRKSCDFAFHYLPVRATAFLFDLFSGLSPWAFRLWAEVHDRPLEEVEFARVLQRVAPASPFYLPGRMGAAMAGVSHRYLDEPSILKLYEAQDRASAPSQH